MATSFLLWLILLLAVCRCCLCDEDLYAILGLSRAANPKAADIKAAYRARAKEVHPDKQLDKDPEVAAQEFRKVAHAYEVLSDPSSRREYDRTGRSDFRQQQQQPQQQQQQQGFTFTFKFKRLHPHMYDPFLRRQILAAQSRVITLRSLDHLAEVAGGSEGVLERYVLLAFVDVGDEDCAHRLSNELLFPWPFAGYSDGSVMGDVYFDDIMLVAKVELDGLSTSDSGLLAARFGVSPSVRGVCPTIALINRGEPLEPSQESASRNYYDPQVYINAWAFSAAIWPKLKVSVTFINRSYWPLDMWWLDGTLGKKITVLAIGETYTSATFLSHVFIFRPTMVEGHSLTNESSLLWFTAKVTDDGSQVPILPRCFESHGDCKRWKSEGFCDTTTPSWYVQQNPSFAPWVQENCILSCAKGCLSDRLVRRRGALARLPDHSYHSIAGPHDEL